MIPWLQSTVKYIEAVTHECARKRARVRVLLERTLITISKHLKMKFVEVKENEIQVGKQKYLFPENSSDDVLEIALDGGLYNKKTYLYPGGYNKEVFANTWTFQVRYPHSSHKFEQETETQKANNLFLEMFLSKYIYYPQAKSEWEKRKEADKRATRKIEDIILLNPDMRYFTTLTFDLEKVKSYDQGEVASTFTQWLKNNTYRKGLKYVFVPEYHQKDNKIHFHGVINDSLTFVDSGTRKVNGFHKPVRLTKITKWLKAGRITVSDVGSVVYNVKEWQFGFSTAVEVQKSIKNVVLYVTKYISKDVMGKNKIFGKRYWSSRNIETLPPILLENVPLDTFDKLNLKEYKSPFDNKSYKYRNNMVERKE